MQATELREHAFESAQSRAWVATFGIIGSTGLQVLFLALEWVEHSWFPDFENDESTAAGVFAVVAGLSGLTLMVALVVGILGYLLWIHRATRNSLALGLGTANTTPRMAVACWFIPFLNLVRPYQVVKALYQTSEPEGSPTDPASRWTWIFPVWWGTWVVSSMLGNRSARRSFSDDPGAEVEVLWLDVVSTPLVVVSAALALTIVWSIEARHRQLVADARKSSGPSPQAEDKVRFLW